MGSELWKQSVRKWVRALEKAEKGELDKDYFFDILNKRCGFCRKFKDKCFKCSLSILNDERICGVWLGEHAMAYLENEVFFYGKSDYSKERIKILCQAILEGVLRNEF